MAADNRRRAADYFDDIVNKARLGLEEARAALAQAQIDVQYFEDILKGSRNPSSPVRSSSAVEMGGLASSVTPGQYRGMPLKMALEPYMKARQGQKVRIDDIVRDLKLGGAVMPLSHTPAQVLRIKIANSKELYGYDHETTEVWLLDKAYEPRVVKPRKKKG